MTQALILAAILIVLGADPMELLAGSIRLFVAIVASLFVVALIIGVVIMAPSLLLWAMSAVMVASCVIAAVEAFNRYRQRHLSSP